MRAKWTFRANDFERVWVNEGDALTATLTPGFAIQAAMPQGTGEGYSVGGRFAIGPVSYTHLTLPTILRV